MSTECEYFRIENKVDAEGHITIEQICAYSDEYNFVPMFSINDLKETISLNHSTKEHV